MIYWLYYYFNRHIGEWVLDMDGTAPYYYPTKEDDPYIAPESPSGPITPTLATISQDGKSIYLVIANGAWDQPVQCNINFRNFEFGNTSGAVLSNSDPNGKPLLEKKEDAISDLPVLATKENIKCTIPGHSVFFLTVRKD